MALGETITVVNKSGKVVSTSKHLVNIFKEAKSAYRERKAELKVQRDAAVEEKQARKAVDRPAIDDESQTPSPASRQSSTGRPPVGRGYSDSFYTNDSRHSVAKIGASGLSHEANPEQGELVRRHTDGPVSHPGYHPVRRMSSMSDADMDSADEELPPPLPRRPVDETMELRGQMTRLQQLLDEYNCVQHSVMATIENLQKNPDALAAVALTLAEISNIASKMAPGVLMSLKGAFPVIVALLLSPEFLIAAGVGVGVTIIALGGYKIIKKIKQRKVDAKDAESMAEVDELQEIRSDLSRVEMWRRGIAEADADGAGTSVEGEYITPMATRYLVSEGVMREQDLKPAKSDKKSKEKTKVGIDKGSKGKKEARKESSGLKMLFKKKNGAGQDAEI